MPTNDDLIPAIEASYDAHPGFRHPFWEWMAAGDFDLATLKEFALFYYQHVRVFRLYLAGAMTIMPSEGLQVTLAAILADEFGLTEEDGERAPSHPDLFRSFMKSLKLTEADWSGTKVIDGIQHFKDTHYGLFRAGLVNETLGAVIFGCENSTPHRHSSVVEGLKRFQATTGIAVDDTFFAAHVTLDPRHAEALTNQLLRIEPPVDKERVMLGVRISFDARKVFLDNLAAELGLDLPE